MGRENITEIIFLKWSELTTSLLIKEPNSNYRGIEALFTLQLKD
jgi:hypothetical protein